MKWQPIIKAGRLNYDQAVLIKSASRGIVLCKLNSTSESKGGKQWLFVLDDKYEVVNDFHIIEDATHFAIVTDPK